MYYSLDGSNPSLPYSEPLPLNSNTTLKFQAVDLQGQLTPIYTEHYVFDTQPPQIIFDLSINQCTSEAFSNLNISGTASDDSPTGLRHLHLQIQNGDFFLNFDESALFNLQPTWSQLSTTSPDWQFTSHQELPLEGFEGSFTIRVRAIDYAGNTTIEEVEVLALRKCS